jgi:lipopolysaccharide export system permease protein
MIKKINLYITKIFINRIFYTFVSFFLLFFIINIVNIIDKMKEENLSIATLLMIAFFKTPANISELITPIILISGILSFSYLSIKNEATIIRNLGFSLWKILIPPIFVVFIFGILWISLFNPFEIWSNRQINIIENNNNIKAELREIIKPLNGIWFRQENEIGENIIINAKIFYKYSTEFANVSVWFYDLDNNFYQRIDAKKMILLKNKLILKDLKINNLSQINDYKTDYEINTNINDNFVIKKIINNYDSAKFYSIFELPKVINEIENSGTRSNKFKIYLHSQIISPFMFIAMIICSCFFGLNKTRNTKNQFIIFCGIIFGLGIFMISSIFIKLGESGILSLFESTWLIFIIILSISILLIFYKENSNL